MKKLRFVFLILFVASAYTQWNIQYTFSPAQSIYALKFFDANTGYCVAPLYNSSTFNIHKTTNAGQNWTDQNSGYTAMRFMGIFILHPDTVYMSGNDGLIIKTVNGGANWVTLYSETGMQFWGLHFTNSFTGFTCGNFGRIMKTTNSGVNWVNQTAPVAVALSSVYFINENTGFICGSTVAFKTTNAGTNWVSMNPPYLPYETLREIYFFNENTGLYVSDLGRIGRTTNSGTNWTLANSNTTQTLMGVWFADASTGYACGYAGTIIKTTDAGLNWSVQTSPANEILPDVCFTSVNTGYISTWSGKVLKTTNGGVLFVNKIGNEVPGKFSLSQNYPNPFNPVTSIRFNIPLLRGVDSEGGRGVLTKLQIYDALGREAATLVNEKLNPGTYETEWKASDYPSGVYYYRIIAGDFSDTKKMILVK